MTRGIGLVLLVLVCGLVGCGDTTPPADPKAFLAEADALFAAAEQRIATARAQSGPIDPLIQAEAVGDWTEAAVAYRAAFRLLDPDPAVAVQRGMLAFRVARAFSKAARHGTDPRWAGLRGSLAMTWLDQAERLAPALRQVHYERATLYDSDIERVFDFVRAHASYTRYLALIEEAGAVPATESTRVTHARERAAALAPPSGS